jgi:hypothetical protein
MLAKIPVPRRVPGINSTQNTLFFASTEEVDGFLNPLAVRPLFISRASALSRLWRNELATRRRFAVAFVQIQTGRLILINAGHGNEQKPREREAAMSLDGAPRNRPWLK